MRSPSQGLRFGDEGDRARRPGHQGGDAEIMVAGGMENMSNAPFALPDARWGYRMCMPQGGITDLVVFDGLYEIFNATTWGSRPRTSPPVWDHETAAG